MGAKYVLGLELVTVSDCFNVYDSENKNCPRSWIWTLNWIRRLFTHMGNKKVTGIGMEKIKSLTLCLCNLNYNLRSQMELLCRQMHSGVGLPKVVQLIKNLPANAEDTRDVGSIPGREDPWSRKWQPTPAFLPGNIDRWRILVGCRPWGCKELDTTEHTCKNILELDDRELVWAGVIHFHPYHYIVT